MTKLPMLYSKNLAGVIQTWRIVAIDDEIEIEIGSTGFSVRKTRRKVAGMKGRPSYEQAIKVARRKYLDKINKDGYLPFDKNNFDSLVDFLGSLSTNKVDSNNRLKPQKAFKGFPKKWNYDCIEQPKVNGLRTMLRLEKAIRGEGMFTNIVFEPVFRSMSGLRYVLPHITDNIDHSIFGKHKDLVFDGELYIPFATLNEIRASVPTELANGTVSNPSGDPKRVGFIVFDLAIPDIIQIDRLKLLSKVAYDNNYPVYDTIVKGSIPIISKLYSNTIRTKDEAIASRELAIVNNFEGLILRNKDSEYGFGSRSSKIMVKLKKFQDTECVVLDIYMVQQDSNRSYINFKLRNDINDAVFEATPMGDEEQRMEYLHNTHYYIGKLATVKFYERSGINKVPFHGNVVSIRDEADI